MAADGQIQPYLAQSVTPNADKTVWTITLRPNVTFSDGSALDATVLKNNLDALKASALTGTALKPIEGFAVTGPMSVDVTCSQPLVAFPYYLATQVGYIVGQSMIDGASNSTPPTPVGTGPFTYTTWNPNDHFTATRNPHYWRSGYPYLDQITFKPIPDTSQREATLKAGGVDLIFSIDPNTVDHFQDQSAYQVVDSLSQKVGEPDMNFIILNCATPPDRRPADSPGPGHGDGPTNPPEALRRRAGRGVQQPVPPRLALLLHHLLPCLQPVRGQAPGGGV